MKKAFALIIILSISFMSCGEDNDDNIKASASTTFEFTHNWDGIPVSSSDFNTIQYTNANGEMLSIERLRYVISDITFTKQNGEDISIDAHNLVNLKTNQNLVFSPEISIPTGVYSNVSFTFGLDNEDNSENHLDLNSENFNVPDLLGGGYHYMQMEGKFINSASNEIGYAYHAIRAVDNPGNPTFPQDTFFEVDLGAVTINNNITFEIKMNIAQWYKDPVMWDLNTRNQMLMPNSAAQIDMSANGKNVFSLGTVTQ